MSIPEAPVRPAVAVISSHVARGSVGNRAMVMALETLGFPVWEIVTVSLPWHPGHGPAPRIVPGEAEFGDYMQTLAGSPHLGELGAVLTGYLGRPAQAGPIADFIAAARKANPSLIHLCDPVIGDQAGLYVPQETAEVIRDRLYSDADIVTPNRFEFAWLTGTEAETNEAILATAENATQRVLVTSAHPLLAGGIGNLLIGPTSAEMAEHRLIPNAPNGTGDLLAALFLARTLMGAAPAKALQQATASVFELVARACKRGSDELMLETDAGSLARPMAMVNMRQLARARTPPQSA